MFTIFNFTSSFTFKSVNGYGSVSQYSYGLTSKVSICRITDVASSALSEIVF
jgi:hypothetical protein